MSSKRIPKTIRDLLEYAFDPDEKRWRIQDSWVAGDPCLAPNTERIVTFLESLGFKMVSRGGGSFIGITTYDFGVSFLDGGFSAASREYETEEEFLRTAVDPESARKELEEYMAENYHEEGAWLDGPRAALFVALGLGLSVSQTFRKLHGLEGVTYEALLERVRLDIAYQATTYVAYDGDERIEIRVRASNSPALHHLLKAHDAEWWAYITAWNPGSVPTPADENAAAQERLRELLRGEGIPFFEGMSEPDDGTPGEGSLLALIDRERALEIGRQFGQSAIVVGSYGWRSWLLWCDRDRADG